MRTIARAMASSVLVATFSYTLGVKTASADCAMDQLFQFPDPPELLPTNGRVVLSLSNNPMPPLALRSGREKVILRTVQTSYDAEGFLYFVLAPTRELRPKSNYSLDYAEDDRPVIALVLRAHGTDYAYEHHPISFSTGEAADRLPPRWRSEPHIAEQVNVGADSYVVLMVAIDEAGPLRVRAEVTRVGSNRGAVSYLRVPKSGRIRIGGSFAKASPN